MVVGESARGGVMGKYLVKSSYTLDGVKGVVSGGGSARREVTERTLRSVGGSLESFYFAFGETDVYIVADLPDNVTAAAVSLVVNAVGGIQASTIPLLTPEEIDEAARRSVDFAPPGG
jgi:uncharacterized protein with GYD domain